MATISLPPLGLYIHLPWCERKCPYCDFNSHESSKPPEQAYVDALLADLAQDRELAQGRQLETLFIGGGTPSLFSAGSIARLLVGVGNILELSPSLEASMEANPGSAEAEKFRGFREAGINRLSLGIQSFDDRHLQALGRVHDGDQARRALAAASEAGFDNLNIDLMHGLPEQTAYAAISDLRLALAHQPTHLSWYQLTIEPNTRFYTQPPRLPGEETLADIQQAGEQLLAGEGYSQYEVSAYSLPGYNCRHNRNYWSFGDYLGIGAGAHGKISYPDGRITRYSKTRLPTDYLKAAGGQRRCGVRTLAREDITGEFMLNALRLNDGFDSEHFSRVTGLNANALQPQLDELCAQGLLQLDGSRVYSTDLGRRFLDTMVAEFFPR